ncbi:MAG: response regulator [Candidatus Wallbacteria bacterium]|nr:response regulator [Candidatus Wallbacteria bacterium]
MDELFSILLVEDDEAHALFIERGLRKAGLANPIVHASDGEEALAMLMGPRALPVTVGLVLLDIRLPKIDGPDVLKKIRSSERFSKLPVVMLSTSNERKDIQGCLELGANSYVTKPIDSAEFLEHVRGIGVYWTKVDRLTKSRG